MRGGAVVLVSSGARSRVVRVGGGGIELFWGAMSLAMSDAEFSVFAAMLAEAARSTARCGEVSECARGRVCRRAMGEVSLSHDGLTLWFPPREFEKFERMVSIARERLSDLAPPPPLGVPWETNLHPSGFN